MLVNDYQKEALKYVNNSLDDYEKLLNAFLGLAGEAGEACDLLKKVLFQGHEDESGEHMLKELGDVAWYLAMASHMSGYSLEEVFATNLEKLQARYPDGYFKVEDSINRSEDDV